jgi:hypothetical protein
MTDNELSSLILETAYLGIPKEYELLISIHKHHNPHLKSSLIILTIMLMLLINKSYSIQTFHLRITLSFTINSIINVIIITITTFIIILLIYLFFMMNNDRAKLKYETNKKIKKITFFLPQNV